MAGGAGYLGLSALRKAGAQGAQDGGHVQAAAVLVLVHDDRRQQQDLAVAPLVIALQHIVRLRHTPRSGQCLTTPHPHHSFRGLTDAEHEGEEHAFYRLDRRGMTGYVKALCSFDNGNSPNFTPEPQSC